MNKKNTPHKHGSHVLNIVEGKIAISGKNVGYIRTPDVTIEIDSPYLKNAFSDDIVSVEIISKKKNTAFGKVLEIVRRSHQKIVGTVITDPERTYIIPDNRRIKKQINITEASTVAVSKDQKVIVNITSWGGEFEHPAGVVEKVLGKKGDHETEMQSIVYEKGFDLNFPPAAVAEAEAITKKEEPIPEDEIASRRDFREIMTCTIDPFDAKDFDDALSFQKLPNGHFEVGIHIADVSHYVREKSELDKLARDREFSVYLVDRTIPMLPEVLSNDLCSLNPEEDKLAFSAVFEIDENGKIYERWFGKTVINSDKRFAYEEAQKSIDTHGLFSEELITLNNIAKKLQTARYKAGAIDFETDEVQFILDDDFKPVKVFRKPRLDTHKLVEEFMLLANREVGELMYKAQIKSNKGVFMYRIHAAPDQEKLTNLSIFLKALGYDFDFTSDNLTSKDIANMLKQIDGKDEESLIKTAAVRSMAKAIYSTKNIGHFGLSFEYYSHFTSPIRRYPDLIAHRILWEHLNGREVSRDKFAEVQNIAQEASQKEISAAEAERESIKFKQVEYMSEHIGEIYEGVISGVTEWGLYVEDNETKAEGMISVRNLGNDFYTLDAKTYSLVGQKKKKRYTLGDLVKFKVVSADLDRKNLDFELIEDITTEHPKK